MDNVKESINFSIYEKNIDSFLRNFTSSEKEKPSLEVSETDYDLDNNKHLKKIYNKRYLRL